MFFVKKNKVTILNQKWEILNPSISFEFIPRINELIFIDDLNQYFRVVNIIYKMGLLKSKKLESIFLIIEEFHDDFNLKKKD
jgi:hypothetical protein